ncbi:MAG: efflux RND transporter periplasmic adaptor subunit [Gemmatimonadales bacterium]|nr:MAG: efflux RND transporter periplasmic adaptor subunit [Gemmatimonadales bacterium]
MSGTRKLVIGVVVVVVILGAVAVSIAQSQDRAVDVRASEVIERDLVATITATGNVRARREVNISSDVMGRVIELNIEEGDEVDRGDVLLRLDPSQTQAAVSRARAALAQAEAQVAQQRANMVQARRELDRLEGLRARDPDLVTNQALEEADTRLQVQRSLLQSAEFGVEQSRAGLSEVEEQLSRTTILAPISGRVTRLNIEEGEMAVVGTMNNPGSLLLTISDLSVVEAVLAVDEIDIPRIALGDSASVELDALPGRVFPSRVAKIGNSSIRPQGGGSQGSVDYEVILTILEPPSELRPDLSATADIIVDRRPNALSVPIIAVTLRGGDEDDDDEDPVEGVFVVRDGKAVWQPVELGITGQEHFEILAGLEAGDSVVSGPYQRIQLLRDGDAVRVEPRASRTPSN